MNTEVYSDGQNLRLDAAITTIVVVVVVVMDLPGGMLRI
jgi:hypothetical protein